MRNPEDVKTIHRFQSFSSRIQSVNVDVSRKIAKRSEVPDDEESFFEEGLLKWRDLNQTAHFNKFYSAVQGVTQTFAQLIHNEQKVVDLLLEHLAVEESMALDALLDLVVQLARDLQKDFYPHFKSFFTVIASILNKYMKSWEVLEQAFTCLSYLFKFLWRKMIQDVKQVLTMYQPLLSESNQNRDYVRRFAAESLSYLLRKVKDKKYLFDMLFSHLEKNTEMVLGVGGLIFEMVKGPKTFFHSCAEEILAYLLQTVGKHGVSSLQFSALQEAFNLMAEHVDQVHTQALWSVLQNAVRVSLSSESSEGSHSTLECVATILLSMIDYKQGCLLPRPCSGWCNDTLLPLITKIHSLPAADGDRFVSLVLQCVSSLLVGEKISIDTSAVVSCLSAIYHKDSVSHLSDVFSFTESLFNYSQFEKDVLRKLLEYCSECLLHLTADQAETHVLTVLSKLILQKRTPNRDGLYTPLISYPLSSRLQSDSIPSLLLRVVEREDINSDIEHIWAALTIMPHYTSMAKDKFGDTLENLLSQLCQQLLSQSQQFSSKSSAVACQCLHTLLWISDSGRAYNVPIFELIEKYPTHEHVLRMGSLYLTHHHHHQASAGASSDLLTHTRFTSLYPILKKNISSPNSQVRRLTLRMLSLFPITAPVSSATSAELSDNVQAETASKECAVFSVCLQSEEEKATLDNYREKLRLLRQLDYDLINQHLPEDGSLHDVPLRYLSAVFYVNFSMLWPETITLIHSHGKSLSKKLLWSCLGEILRTAATNCCKGETPSSDSDTECEESCPLIELFNSSCNEETTSAVDRVDYYNHRQLLWKAMLEFPNKCEQNSKTIVELFFKFLEGEYYISAFYDAPIEDLSRRENKSNVDSMDVDDDTEPQHSTTVATDSNADQKKKRTKVIYQTFITKLTLFSKFHNPVRVSQEPRLHKLYNDLLLHRDMAIQQVVLKCLMTYKKKHLLPYSENFERLLDDNTFRTELTMFSIDSENSVIKEEDRAAVMTVLIRILYGRMLHSAGKETKGRGGKSDIRRTRVLSFLAGCREQELSILLDLVCEPFAPLLQTDYMTSLDLSKATPPRRVLGVLSTVVMVMDKLGHLLMSHLSRLLHLLLSLIRYAAFLLDEKREEINHRTINSMKTARQTAIKCLAQFMDKNTDYEFSESEVTSIFDVAVWPQLPRLPTEGTSAPTALLILIETWTNYRRYLPLLLKKNLSTSEYPLSAVMQLLDSPICKLSVGSVIMNITENILDFHTSTSTVMDADDLSVLPLGDIVEVDDSAGSYEVGMLLPHLSIVINYIKDRVSRATLRGTNQTAFPMKELNILSVCSQYVDAPDLCAALLSQLLPFLTGGSSRLSEEVQCGIIKTLGFLAKKTEDVDKQLCKLLTLSSTLTQRLARMHMVKMFDSLADLSNDCKEVADFVREVNAFDRNRIEEPDYDSRLGSYREIVWWDYEKCALSLVVAIIHNSYYTLRYVDDMALRDSSAAALQMLVKKMPPVHYERCVGNHLVPLVRIGIQLRHDTIRSEFLAILRDMVASRPDLYADMVGLANPDNVEDDFWENIRHIQVSRRLKGLNRLMRHLDTVQMKNTTLTKYLLPLVFSFIKDETDYHKKNAMVDVCIATVGALCKQLAWSAYKSQLKVSLNLLTKIENNKMAVRLICTIMDSFHFDLSLSSYIETQMGKEITTDIAVSRKVKNAAQLKDVVADSERPDELPIASLPLPVDAEANQMDNTLNDDIDEGIDLDSETQDTSKLVAESDVVGPVSAIVNCPKDLATSIHSYIIGSVLPQLHKILSKKSSTDDLHKENKSIHPDQDEIQRAPLAIAIVKLLQKISSATLERHLPTVLMKVCYFMKSRAEDIRDAARQTLAKMLGSLGVSYMPTITDHLKSTLVKGYQVNVLAYSLHYILSQNIKMIQPGDLTPCLHNLVYINMNGLFGSSSHEKDIDKHDTSKEKRKPQHYELFGLLAKFATPPTIAVILVPLKEKLDAIRKSRDLSKLKQSLDKIADGLLQNKGLSAEQYLKFTYGLISDSVGQLFLDKRAKQEAAAQARRLEKEKVNSRFSDTTFIIPAEPGRAQPLAPTLKKSNKHVMVEFGMKLFHMLLKKAKVMYNNEDHARMVDPFVQPLLEALTAENVPVVIESLICLTFVIKFKGLPSLLTAMEKIVSSLFLLLNTYGASGVTSGESFELCQLCFRFISMVLKTCSYYQWTEDKIEVLLSYAESDIVDPYKQATAFSLLKAVISRKLLCKLLYDVMKKVEELSVKSESSEVRLHCRQVVLQFLLDYPLGKALPKHINFYLDNLDYKAEHGRESIYEMLGAILTAFPQKTVHTFSSTLFISLARARVNDESEKCRKLAALGVKTLLGRVERNYRTKLFSMAFKWLQEQQVEIVQMAAQIIGLFIEVECDSFSSRFTDFLPLVEKSLQPQIYITMEGESDDTKDLQLYHIILMTMRMIRECPRVLRQPICDEILEHLRQHMLHPHAWVRFATAQVFGLVFSTYNPDELVAAVLSQPTDQTSITKSPHKSMAFLLTGTRQKLRDFTADFCTQLSSRFMEEEFAAQIVKNLVFLVKVIQRLPESKVAIPAVASETPQHSDDESHRSSSSHSADVDLTTVPTTLPSHLTEPSEIVSAANEDEDSKSAANEDEDSNKQSVSVHWLIRRLGKVAMFEATNSPRESTKRTNVFKCLAAIAMELGPELLQQQLKNILPPVHRELSMVRLFTETEDLRNLAGEVSNLLKNTVGVSNYSAVYASVHRAANERKADRKRKLAQQAVTNPSIGANKKMRLHTKKHNSKRVAQKKNRFQGNKVVKKKRIARDMAIMQ